MYCNFNQAGELFIVVISDNNYVLHLTKRDNLWIAKKLQVTCVTNNVVVEQKVIYIQNGSQVDKTLYIRVMSEAKQNFLITYSSEVNVIGSVITYSEEISTSMECSQYIA